MIWNLEKFKRNSKAANQDCVKVFSDVHTKGIRNAICSTNETEIISISFDQSCAITNIENGIIYFIKVLFAALCIIYFIKARM